MSEQLSKQTYFDQAIGFTFSYYDIPEVDRLVMKLENQIEQLKAETRTDNSAVIEKMATEIAELKDKLRWRKFPDKKPEWGKEVIVVDDASKQYIVRFSYDMKWISWGNMNTCESKYVKYWMPLPAAPKEEMNA